ncbi:MAG: methyltransferase domain-containing protein [Phenylobacterium sp.]|uniref:methyltransferase domain-containing protein n=1 Tax=Phenylobacterium sp. TaxID=1871053 RepID=UPI0012238D89|nr:methyltransferase domain-containing protein [Phenylobacterium sp.]TAJ68410.1 MAG: methyltransferase domain-containing protein [Phenylobacterium sp.]
MSEGYHASRLTQDTRRNVLWSALWRFYFRRRIAPGDCVLDLGSGYGEFINNVVAARRLAVDTWPRLPDHVAPGVEAHVGMAQDLDWIADGAVDFAFASNLFEHLSQDAFAATLAALRTKLSAKGSLTILQPNYRYAYREYFDDYTHIAVYSHVSIVDFLTAHGWEVQEVQPRFLPLTIKSRLPVSPLLIAAYLASPIRPLGKQMLISARPVRGGGA